MSLINDMLSDMKRRDKRQSAGVASRAESVAPQNKDSQFNSTVMYNPYSQSKKLGTSSFGFDWRSSQGVKIAALMGIGAILATGIHFGTKSETSYLRYAMSNDPFYVLGTTLYQGAYQLFRPESYFTAQEVTGSNELVLPERPVFVYAPPKPDQQPQWQLTDDQQPSEFSAWVGNAVTRFFDPPEQSVSRPKAQMPAAPVPMATVPTMNQTPSVKIKMAPAEEAANLDQTMTIATVSAPETLTLADDPWEVLTPDTIDLLMPEPISMDYTAALEEELMDTVQADSLVPVLEADASGLSIRPQVREDLEESLSAEKLFAPPPKIISVDEGVLIKNTRTQSQVVHESLHSADALQVAGRFQEAEQVLFEQLQQYPKNTELRVALTHLYLKNDKFESAEKIAKVGRYLNPGDQNYTRLLARIFAAQDNLSEAVGVLLDNPPRIQDQPDHYSTLAAIYQKQGRHDLAIQLYWDLVELYPESGRWWTGLGISLEASKSEQLAVDSYVRALGATGLPPKLRGFVNERVKVLSQNGRISSNSRTPDRSEYQLK